MKVCSRCGEGKLLTEFYAKMTGRDGYAAHCKPCHYARQRDADPDFHLKAALASRRRDAKAKGIPFSITISDLLPVPDICPVLGIPMRPGPSGGADFSPSIDRIVPDRGYVKGNVIVVSLKANRIKNDATLADLQAVVKFYQTLTK